MNRRVYSPRRTFSTVGGWSIMTVADKLRALQIKVNLIADDMVGDCEIEVEVREGTAVLTGEVDTQEQKRTAEELAYEADGVREVRNKLEVVPSSPGSDLRCRMASHMGYGLAEGAFGDTAFSLSAGYQTPGPGFATSEQFPGQFTDHEIEQEVHRKLESQTEVDVSDVEFRSDNQMVYLSGVVQTSDDLNVLQDMVLSVRGAMGVCSDVSIREGEVGTPVE
jgi:osmotically-inducible protein OsmY